MLGFTDEAQHLMSLYKTDEEFEELERLMMAAIEAKPKTPPKQPNRPGLPPAEEVNEIIRVCDNAYDCNELNTMANMYGVALQNGIDWIPRIKARMALGCVACYQVDTAYKLATESYQQHPEEIDAYWAMAMILKSVDNPFQARKWFDLFKSASQTMPYGAAEFERYLEVEIRLFARRETTILKILTTPKFIEASRKDRMFEHFIKEEKAMEGLQRIQEDPTPATLRREFSRNVQFRYPVLLLKTREYPFETLSADELTTSLVESAPLFANWDENLASYFVHYLPIDSHSNLQTTCKPLRDLFNRPKVWENALSIWSKLIGQGKNMMGGLPPRMVSQLGVTPKTVIKNLSFCLKIMSRLSQAPHDPSTNSRDELFTDVCEQYDFCPLGQYDALGTWAFRLLDTLALGDDGTAWAFAALLTFNLLYHNLTFAARTSTFLDLISMLALKTGQSVSEWSIACVSSLFPIITQDTPRASATMAMLQGGGWFSQFNVRALAPHDTTRFLNTIFDDSLDLSGIYHTFMSYENPDLYGCFEKGVAEVSFTSKAELGTNRSFSGKGVDTLGSFTFSTEVSFAMGESGISWVQKYDNGVSLQFVGVLQPSGFGGYFGHPDETSDPENPKILGYWAMVLDTTPLSELEGARKAYLEQVMQEKEKRKSWKIQQPLTCTEQSPLAAAVTALKEMRMQHQVLLSAYSPTNTIYAIAAQLANSIAPAEDALPVPPQRANWESDMKYSLRIEGLKLVSTAVAQARIQVFLQCKSKIKPDLLILKNTEHPKFLETYAWWSYHLKLSGEPLDWFVAEMDTISRHFETVGLTSEEEVEKNDSDFAGAISNHRNKAKRTGISTNTFLALSAIGIAALSIGAFMVGRIFSSKNKD